MEFDPRRAFNIEALGIAAIVPSVATLVVLLFAIADQRHPFSFFCFWENDL
jgi:hypothetical protein